MISGRQWIRIVVGTILLLTVVSGPLVPGVSFTRAQEETDFGNGTAQISEVEFAETAVIEPLRFGGDAYILDMPPTRIAVDEVSGNPLVTYKISISSMNTTLIQTYQLSPEDTNQRVQLQFEKAEIRSPPAHLDNVDAELTLTLRNRTGKQVIDTTNISISTTHR